MRVVVATDGSEIARTAARQARELDVEALGAIEETVRDLGAIAVDRRVVTGEPGPAICHLADELHADAVVVGSHGRGLLK